MWFWLTFSYWSIQKLKSSGRKNGQFSCASATPYGIRRYTGWRQCVQCFLSQLGQKCHYFNKKTGWFQGLKRPVFDAKVAELFRKSCPFGHKCKYCLPKTAMHGSSFSISSENPYKNEMTLWHVKEQIIKQDNTHKKAEGLHFSNRGWYTHGFRHIRGSTRSGDTS